MKKIWLPMYAVLLGLLVTTSANGAKAPAGSSVPAQPLCKIDSDCQPNFQCAKNGQCTAKAPSAAPVKPASVQAISPKSIKGYQQFPNYLQNKGAVFAFGRGLDGLKSWYWADGANGWGADGHEILLGLNPVSANAAAVFNGFNGNVG